jgi:hypothetical protein
MRYEQHSLEVVEAEQIPLVPTIEQIQELSLFAEADWRITEDPFGFPVVQWHFHDWTDSYPGNWIVRYGDGSVSIWSDSDFQAQHVLIDTCGDDCPYCTVTDNDKTPLDITFLIGFTEKAS